MENIVDYEKFIIKLLFTNESARDKIYPVLDPEIFDGDFGHVEITEKFIEFKEKYSQYPSIRDFRNYLTNKDVFEVFNKIMDSDFSEINQDFINEEAEEFFKKKLLINHALRIVETVRSKGASAAATIPDDMKDALSFTFDDKVGLDMFGDASRLYESMHAEDGIVPTGMRKLDKLIKGGFHKKTLTLITAGSNIGKTALKCALASNIVMQNKNVLYITLEMSEEKISERIMANIFNFPIDKLPNLSEEQLKKKMADVSKSMAGRIFVKEYPPHGANANTIRNLLKELSLKKKFVPDIIFIDYLGIIASTSKMVDGNTYIIYKRVSEELRGLAVEYGIPVVSSNQLNRGAMGSSDVDMSDISDSIGQAMTADIIFGLVQTEEMREKNIYMLKILKNRYGDKFTKMILGVDYRYMKIFELEEDSISENDGNFKLKKEVSSEENTNFVSPSVSVSKSFDGIS